MASASKASKSPFSDDATIHSNYVQHTLQNQKPLPPITLSNFVTEVVWVSAIVLFITPIIGLVGACYVPLQTKTAIWAISYYYITGLGITAGYHRLWAHRAYNATTPLQYFLALAGAGAAEGSIRWWSRGHRAHHRYTDTELDPYNAHKGFAWSHIVWMLVRPRRNPGYADVSDLRKNPVAKWQDKHFPTYLVIMAFIFPTLVAYYGWGDAMGGFVYAAVLRLVFVHHSTFCVNSLAHWLGETPFDDKHTPRDHFITALVTIGEGYHNFHHQFPMDYRNAIKWYQYDPTKWFIWTCEKLGLASQLKTFPGNEIRKGQLTMEMKKLREQQDAIIWPHESCDLPVVSWDSFVEQSATRPLVLISGFIHDVGSFMPEHPGGAHLLKRFIGGDATTAFFGGVYDHSNAAHNLLAMKRVGILHGGYQLLNPQGALGYSPPGTPELGSTGSSTPTSTTPSIPPTTSIPQEMIPPSQRLRVARWDEAGWSKMSVAGAINNGWGSEKTAYDGDDNEEIGLKKF